MEDKLQVFLGGVRKYFYQWMSEDELEVGTPYLIESSQPSVKDYTGVITIKGINSGMVYFTAEKELLDRLLLLMGESAITAELMADLVGEVANTIAGNARSEFGEEFDISVPIVLRGSAEEITLPHKDRSFVIPLKWQRYSAFIVIALRK